MKQEYIVIGFYGIFALLLIYLIVRRMKDKKKEKFEDRDN